MTNISLNYGYSVTRTSNLLIRIVVFVHFAIFGLIFGTEIKSVKAEENSVTIGNWENYIDPKLIIDFEHFSNLRVNLVTYSSNENLEKMLINGDIKFDIAIPSLNLFGARGIMEGLYQPLEKSRIKNYSNIDPKMLQFMALSGDFNNSYAVPWASGNLVLGVNEKLVKKYLRNPSLNSLSLVFDPAIVKKLQKCGVMVLDSPSEMLSMMLNYLGKNPNTEDESDLKLALTRFKQLRPYYKDINSTEYYPLLAQGKICVALGYSNDILIGQSKANKKMLLKNKIEITDIKEGTVAFVDSMMIPKTAKNLDGAYQFINFMLRPEISAKNSEYLHANMSNVASKPHLSKELLNNPIIFPSDEVRSKFFSLQLQSTEFDKLRVEGWDAMKNSK